MADRGISGPHSGTTTPKTSIASCVKTEKNHTGYVDCRRIKTIFHAVVFIARRLQTKTSRCIVLCVAGAHARSVAACIYTVYSFALHESNRSFLSFRRRTVHSFADTHTQSPQTALTVRCRNRCAGHIVDHRSRVFQLLLSRQRRLSQQ